MSLLKSLMFLLFPMLGFSVAPECIEELQQNCGLEIHEKNQCLEGLRAFRFPPTQIGLENFEKFCQNQMDCAAKLDCFKEESNVTIFENCCDPHAATIYYEFDEECLFPLMKEINKETYYCTRKYHDQLRDPTALEEVFKKGSTCFLEISSHICNRKDHAYLKQNYDEIMKMYSVKPNDSEYCNSSFNKFHKMQCDAMKNGMESRLRKLPLINTPDTDVQEAIGMCKEAQKFVEEVCLYKSEEEKKIEAVCESLEKLKIVLKNVQEDKTKLKNNTCMNEMGFMDFFEDYSDCVIEENTDECFMDTVEKLCRSV